MVVIKRRAKEGWKGASERGNPDTDIFVVLSQDRWVWLTGHTNDIKRVTAGQWLREESPIEKVAVSVATLLVYLSAAFAGNASTTGSLLLACLLLSSAGILATCNGVTNQLRMYGLTVKVTDRSYEYRRRGEMAEEVIKKVNRDDWAIRMGLILEEDSPLRKVQGEY